MNVNEDRREMVNAKLQQMLETIRKEKPHLKNLPDVPMEDDVFSLYLKGKAEDIQKVKVDIEAYENKGLHFTKQYRTLEGHCGKLQRDLDKIDVFGRDDLKAMRKKALLDVDTLIKSLTKKAHPDGIVCDDCEVQN